MKTTSLFLHACCVLMLLSADLPARAEPKPNIILMMADDMGWGDPHCFNPDSPIHTPHLDAMAAAGMKFNRFYAAAPVCSPTRGSCLTGRHPFRYGVYTANAGHMKPQEITLAELLKQHGYATGHFGKWHLGTLTPDYSGKGAGRDAAKNYSTPGMNGFDEWFSTEFAVATWDPYDPQNSHLNPNQPRDTRALYWHNGTNVTEALAGDDSRIIMDQAIPFLRRAAQQSQPFFAVIWFHAPHAPVVGGPEYRARYAAFDSNAQHYYACITALDEQVGRLRQELRVLSVAQNTMLWFCSDNGPEGRTSDTGRYRGSAGFFRGRKRSLYEGGVRVPGLLEWPARIQPEQGTDFPAVTSDYLPTILEIIGANFPDQRPIDGISLVPMLEGRMKERSQPIGFQSGKQLALTTQQDKLYSEDGGQTWELYDLLSDRAETKNLARERPGRVRELAAMLEQWRASCARSDRGADYSPRSE